MLTCVLGCTLLAYVNTGNEAVLTAWPGVHLSLQRTPAVGPEWAARSTKVGTWLSLVERTLGVGEVASSNLVVPTISLNCLAMGSPHWSQPWGA